MTVRKGENKQLKIIIIAVLLVILCIVGYFRFFSKKSTGTIDEKPLIAPAVSPSVAPANSASPQKTDTQEALSQTSAPDIVRDVFEPGKSARLAETKRKESGEIPPPVQLVLNGMIYSGKNPVAIINGQLQHVGDQIGEYRIIRIGPKEVLLKGEEREITLRVIDYGKK
ncbi:MAG: hypothetical protein NT010_12410 [Proteobacteria bacterium]|nr:hypothetical protein [Pseudomonadota bacterium]